MILGLFKLWEDGLQSLEANLTWAQGHLISGYAGRGIIKKNNIFQLVMSFFECGFAER